MYYLTIDHLAYIKNKKRLCVVDQRHQINPSDTKENTFMKRFKFAMILIIKYDATISHRSNEIQNNIYLSQVSNMSFL